MVPTDFSDYADVALGDALGLAETCSGVIHLTHVIREVPKAFKPNEFYEEQKPLAMKALEEQIAKFDKPAAVKIEPVVLTGHVSTTLLNYQKKIRANIVVVTTQGQTAFEDFLMGSTARRLMRHSSCSVLVVRKPKYRKKWTASG
jgi:nucleotide-binding universal stress UspA family protein